MTEAYSGESLSSGTGGSSAPAAKQSSQTAADARPPRLTLESLIRKAGLCRLPMKNLMKAGAALPACRQAGRPPDSPSAKPSSGGLRELPSDSPSPNSSILYLILDGAHSGAFNMQTDAALFQGAIRNQSRDAVLRIYRFSEPCWTVGYGIWKLASFPKEVRAVRRVTGGGIVKHEGDLTYAFIAPYRYEEPLGRVRKSYFFIHEALCRALFRFGLAAQLYRSHCGSGDFCFDAPVTDDCMFNGTKIAGGAQKRSQGYLLHQGSMDWPFLLRIKPDLSEPYFAKAFAEELGHSLGFSVKESSLNTDIEHTECSAVWNQPS